MATKKNTAVGQTTPAPASAPATGSITLPEMPPAESFVGLVAYGVDTTTDESKHIPLEFLGRGVQACIDATQASTEQTELAKTATSNADTATTGANDAAETARGEAANLSALKEAVANATADAIGATTATKSATENANAATTNANEATADAIEKTEAAQTATNEAIAAKDAAIEATENLMGDVSALVLTDANKARIQELAGIDYSQSNEQDTGEIWITPSGQVKKVYVRTWRGTTPATWSTYGSGLPYEFKYFTLPSSKFNPAAVWLEVGMIGPDVTGVVLNALPLKTTTGGAIQVSYSDYLGGIAIAHSNATGLTGAPYSITVKYVK